MFIDLTQQCCDADEYLNLGYVCAQTGDCYNSLRPIGNALWFGIPYFLNTTEDILFYTQLFLFSLLGGTFFYLLTTRSIQKVHAMLSTSALMLALAALLWPTFFNTLSDTPATLLLLEGIILLLIGDAKGKATWFLAAGIALGLSAILRTAYFIPLCLAAVIFFLSWAWHFFIKRNNEKISSILIISFMIPIMLQFYTTWKHTGEWNFLSEARSKNMMQLHLDSVDAGYDTGLQQSRIFWSPDCAVTRGLISSVLAADIDNTYCLLKNRLRFYLGSYAPRTFLGSDGRNFLDNVYADRVTQSISTIPLPAGHYQHRIWLRSDSTQTLITADIELASVSLSSGPTYVINTQKQNHVILTNQMQVFTTDINSNTRGYIVTRITSDAVIQAEGAMLQEKNAAEDANREPLLLKKILGDETNISDGRRMFSKLLLVLSVFIIIFAACYLFICCRKPNAPTMIFISAFLLAILAQCLVIIPEQRYFQAILGASWLFFILGAQHIHAQYISR